MSTRAAPAQDETVKASCACVYESDLARYLLGDSFHPGGLELTEHVGEQLGLGRESRLLDVAAGNGASSLFLAKRFGCAVEGIDYGARNVEKANVQAAVEGVRDRVVFTCADAEAPPFDDASFDAILCECSFCLFPNKDTAANAFARLLRPGGRVAISDLTRRGPLPEPLSGLLAWIACIADALPTEEYVACLDRAGLAIEAVEDNDHALLDLVKTVQLRLMTAEILAGLDKLNLPGVDFVAAREMAREAMAAIHRGELGYVTVVATKAAVHPERHG